MDKTTLARKDKDELADFIAQELLEQTGKAMLAGDFESFKTHFGFPLRVETLSDHKLIETEEELRTRFDAVFSDLKTNGVEDFVRTVILAEFIDEDTIRSVHLSSEIHKNGELRHPAYPVHSTLARDGDFWRIVTCHYIIRDNPGRNEALTGQVATGLLKTQGA